MKSRDRSSYIESLIPYSPFGLPCQPDHMLKKHLARSREYVKETYKFEGYGCGLCQVGVPCETGIPVKAAREALERGELPSPPPPLA